MSQGKTLPPTRRQIAAASIDLLLRGQAPQHVQQQAIDYLLTLASELDLLTATAERLGSAREEYQR